MKFTDFDKQMRIYETAHDYCVPPNIYIVARLDGRCFSKLTTNFDHPYDAHFATAMYHLAQYLMTCGFKVIYAYTQSDEVSLLFSLKDNTFSRKTRKLSSILAGEASAYLTNYLKNLNLLAAFDCRICQLPNKQIVIDYFRWRQEDATRNALNSACYWALRDDEYTAAKATKHLLNKSVADKNEILFLYGINFNDLPIFQKRGIGIVWTKCDSCGHNPLTGVAEAAERNSISTVFNLPKGEDYADYISSIIEADL
jgi:tRNA(His) 5'-end guanylyltransferase